MLVKENGNWKIIRGLYVKNSGVWTLQPMSQLSGLVTTNVCHYGEYESENYILSILGPVSTFGESCQYSLTRNNLLIPSTNVSWSIASGSTYATINQNGTLTILSGANNSSVVISAEYQNKTKEQTVHVTYQENVTTSSQTSSETITVSGETIERTTTTTEITDSSGNTTTASSVVEVVTNASGETTYREINTVTNSDGSYTGNTTNYDSEGDETGHVAQSGDTSGNVSTQTVIKDNEGNDVVTGYEIDTSNNSGGTKTYNGDGVNTEYYAFDMTHGFVLDFSFTIDFTNQPADQNENHHNILTMKRSTPSPWYGFQLRQSSKNRYIILGTQFDIGSNTNTTISATTSGDVALYNLRITYDPTVVENTFVCRDMSANKNVYTSNGIFPDIDELRYLKVTIGYAMDENGDPYRYSNINVLNFSIRRLYRVSDPVITCDGEHVSISCETSGSSISYRLNQSGNYSEYTSPITITADTIVEAYAVFSGNTSNTVTTSCTYNSGVEPPMIDCDGEEITMTCETPSVDMYYRLNRTGSFIIYETPIAITSDTIIDAYSVIDGKTSSTVSATCLYELGLKRPSITCDGQFVTITCETSGATIYYLLNQTGNYAQYSVPIEITADTVVQAYSVYNGQTSVTVTETCVYSDVHDYSADYLTFRILTGGTISWNAFGSGYNKVIEYSIDNGQWISITGATSSTISVQENSVVRFRGNNSTYAGSKSNYNGFEGSSAVFNIEGNIMSLVYGDNFSGNTTLSGTYNFCSIFKKSNVVSAENLILPSSALTNYCYRAMFSLCPELLIAPELPAVTLAQGCYWYMFEGCPITVAPDLNAVSLVKECYGNMFNACSNLSYIKCLATNAGSSPASALTNWVINVAASGMFVKDSNTSWNSGNGGIPYGWVVYNDTPLYSPEISFDGVEFELTCKTTEATLYYRLGETGEYSAYTSAVMLTADTVVEAYSSYGGQTSLVVSMNCEYISDIPFEASNRSVNNWTYNNQDIQTPYSVNAIDGHSSSYARGTFNFETNINLRSVQPTYLWFQHADQSADIYVDDVRVETHWGGYNAFFSDISSYVHTGTNRVKVALCNTTRTSLAPAAGDFNFNATLGEVKLFTSPVLPDVSYGYDGFHVTSTVSSASSATITVRTNIPASGVAVCTIDDGTYHYSDTANTTGNEIQFIATVPNPHLWNGTIDPHLYNITLEIYYNGDLYHRFQRPYGLRYYSYVINDTTILPNNEPYTGFLLNGSPYLLRGVCMHDDVDGKANALTTSDYTQEFNIIRELGCNFIRLAHYPHPKEVYDWCDQLGIIVQTEVPCVNKLQSTMPEDYYTHLEGQYEDMVNQHYNHPCILFWGLSNETTTDDKDFAKAKIESYRNLIKNLDPERWVGYVMSHSYNNPSTYYNDPDVDWFGCNIYVGWYIDKASNDPTSQLNTRITNIVNNLNKPLAYSEYGCGGTQHCHSDNPASTTTKGNYERHDIEYQMWLHEGHIAAIRNFPQLMFAAQWQLFDIAVSSRNEGYTICLDGETTSVDNNLRRLNNKGLVERDHITKKDTFYIYKAEWSSERFVHICGKDYTKMTDRVIKCYTNDGSSLSLYVNGILTETITVSDHIGLFTARTYNTGDVIRVDSTSHTDTFTF